MKSSFMSLAWEAWSVILAALALIGTAIGTCVGGLFWLFRLDRRITVLEEKSTLTMAWLERIEGKLDRVLEK